MGIVFLATGSPETGRSVNELAQELAYAMGRNFDLGKAAPSKPDALILNVFAVAPLRGAIPNGTSYKRSRAEFWSAYNIDFEKYVASDARGKLEAMGTALIGAINQVPDSRMTGEQKRHFEAALMNGIGLLLSEPDRMRRFQHPLQLE
jgi:hypothetical protein